MAEQTQKSITSTKVQIEQREALAGRVASAFSKLAEHKKCRKTMARVCEVARGRED
jgi:hypothetical protein